MAVTTIEWTHRRLPSGRVLPGYTRNVVWSCVAVSPGCAKCYDRSSAERTDWQLWGRNIGRRTFGDASWREPLKWNKEATVQGHRHNVFCSSMGDTFEDHPIVEQERQANLWPVIAQTLWLNWLLLTKRPENMLNMAPWPGIWPDHAWAMTSVENQQWAAHRVPLLLDAPAVVHGLCVEPLLAPVDLSAWLDHLQSVIVGGEGGPGHRPIERAWVRFLRDQCVEAGATCFFKQWGGLSHSAGGHMLDGREWNEMPPEVCLHTTSEQEREVQV